MALRVKYIKKIKGTRFVSGHLYQFSYAAWSNDPRPTYIHMYAFEGYHPTTGRQWRFIQGLNLTYVPRSMRRAFARDWVKVFERTKGNTIFTWNIVLRRYPFLKYSVRRYFYTPSRYLSKINEIPFKDMEKIIVSTWSRDFSKTVKTALLQKFQRVMRRRKSKFHPGRGHK